jgi:hypothetical protein
MPSGDWSSSILIYAITFMRQLFQMWARVAFPEFFDLGVPEKKKYSITNNGGYFG